MGFRGCISVFPDLRGAGPAARGGADAVAAAAAQVVPEPQREGGEKYPTISMSSSMLLFRSVGSGRLIGDRGSPRWSGRWWR